MIRRPHKGPKDHGARGGHQKNVHHRPNMGPTVVRGPRRADVVHAALSEMEPMTLELHDNPTIAGTLRGDDGKPVVGAIVAFWPLERAPQHGAAACWGQSAPDATFAAEITGQPAGRYRITVSPWLNAPLKLRPARPFPIVELRPHEPRRDGVLSTVERPSAALQGRVIDRSGEPLADVELQVVPAHGRVFESAGPRALSSTDGSFVIDGLPAGDYQLLARRGSVETRVEANTRHSVVVTLPAP